MIMRDSALLLCPQDYSLLTDLYLLTMIACGVANSSRFGGDQGLVVERVEQIGFDELSLPKGCFDAQQWFVGKDYRTFRDSPEIAREPSRN